MNIIDFRAKLICRKLGLKPFGITSKSPVPQRINDMIREYFATTKDWLYFALFSEKKY